MISRRTVALDNGLVRLEALADGGPRIVGLELEGRHVFGAIAGPERETPWGTYRLFGGHRLWHAPESPPWTCVPDDGGLAVAERPGTLVLERFEEPTRLRKTIEVHLSPAGAEVAVTHVVRNEGDEPVELAPWAITLLPLGGIAVLPQETDALDEEARGPNRTLVLWPYTSFADPRLELGDDAVLVRGAPGPELKIGQRNTVGWASYERDGVVFRKSFEPAGPFPYPDLGCNVEVYACAGYLELETLGPLQALAPGDEARHAERWQLRATDARPGELRRQAGIGLAGAIAFGDVGTFARRVAAPERPA